LSLTNWSAAYYVDQTAGAESGQMARDLLIRLPYEMVLQKGDERLDQSVDKYDDDEYTGIVYGKGALMYDVLRKQLGDPHFFDFLHRYLQTYQFRRADRAAWQKTLAEVAGQETATAFYNKWVDGDAVREADLPPGGAMSELFNTPALLDLLQSLNKQMQKDSGR